MVSTLEIIIAILLMLVAFLQISSSASAMSRIRHMEQRIKYWDEKFGILTIDLGNAVGDIGRIEDELEVQSSMIADSDRGIHTLGKTVQTQMQRIDGFLGSLARMRDEVGFLFESEERIRRLEEVWTSYVLYADQHITIDDFLGKVKEAYGRINGVHEGEASPVASGVEGGGVELAQNSGGLSEGDGEARPGDHAS